MKPDVSLPPSLPFIWHFGNFPGRGRVKVTCLCNFVIHHKKYFLNIIYLPQIGGDPRWILAPIYNTTPIVKKPFSIVFSFLGKQQAHGEWFSVKHYNHSAFNIVTRKLRDLPPSPWLWWCTDNLTYSRYQNQVQNCPMSNCLWLDSESKSNVKSPVNKFLMVDGQSYTF